VTCSTNGIYTGNIFVILAYKSEGKRKLGRHNHMVPGTGKLGIASPGFLGKSELKKRK
jgi:hypothetical protein